MTEVTLAAHGDLFCIPCGDGHTSLGFDVCQVRTRRLAEWLGLDDPNPIAPRGTLESYAEYQTAMDAVSVMCRHFGSVCDVELSPQLAGLEGKRVEVVDVYGGTRRFKVGRSTGWLPCHLELANSRSSGGMAADKKYASVRIIR